MANSGHHSLIITTPEQTTGVPSPHRTKPSPQQNRWAVCVSKLSKSGHGHDLTDSPPVLWEGAPSLPLTGELCLVANLGTCKPVFGSGVPVWQTGGSRCAWGGLGRLGKQGLQMPLAGEGGMASSFPRPPSSLCGGSLRVPRTLCGWGAFKTAPGDPQEMRHSRCSGPCPRNEGQVTCPSGHLKSAPWMLSSRERTELGKGGAREEHAALGARERGLVNLSVLSTLIAAGRAVSRPGTRWKLHSPRKTPEVQSPSQDLEEVGGGRCFRPPVSPSGCSPAPPRPGLPGFPRWPHLRRPCPHSPSARPGGVQIT